MAKGLQVLKVLSMTAWLGLSLLIGAMPGHAEWGPGGETSAYILEHTKEEVLGEKRMYPKDEKPAYAKEFGADRDRFYFSSASLAVYAVPAAYDEVVAEIGKRVTNRFGIAIRESHSSYRLIDILDDRIRRFISRQSLHDPAHKSLLDRERREWKKHLGKMASFGFAVDGLKLTKIESKPYNRFPKRQANSTAFYYIVNAQSLFGARGTVIMLMRLDKAKVWGFRSVHDPFSFGYRFNRRFFVTRTEHAIIDAWAVENRIKYQVFPMRDFPPYNIDLSEPLCGARSDRNLCQWSRVRQWLSERK